MRSVQEYQLEYLLMDQLKATLGMEGTAARRLITHVTPRIKYGNSD
ncbi:hypothetical protein [Paenibacillus pini]|nr:hypothetical protein [Paenibacillus pini]